MGFSRRSFLHLAGGAAALPPWSRLAVAETYPARPVRVIVGYAAGGIADVAARLMAQWLTERLNQTFVVEDRPGAGTNIGADVVVHAPPDGYTFLLMTSANTINTTLYENLDFDILRDITPVARINTFPLVMVVTPSFPAKTVAEFIAYAKANPGKINMASVGVGSSPHISGEMFQMMTGVKMVHVPFHGGGAALNALLGGQVEVFFPGVSGYIELIKTGKLRALAMMSATPLPVLPDVPLMKDTVPGLVSGDWTGLGAPTNTPADVIDIINRQVNAGLADDKVKARFAALGGTPDPGSTQEFGDFLRQDVDKWRKVIRAANIKAE
jgi:tripartite-type tricarboxylate transporter receptor subunit TctC